MPRFCYWTGEDDNATAYPNLGRAITIELNGENDNATAYPNLGRPIVKKTTVKISGTAVMSIDGSDLHHWALRWSLEVTILAIKHGLPRHRKSKHVKTRSRRRKREIRLSLAPSKKGSAFRWILNCSRCICLPTRRDRLEYELNFNDYDKVIKAIDPDSKYIISNMLWIWHGSRSEFPRQIRQQFSDRMAVLYDRILRYRKIAKTKINPTHCGISTWMSRREAWMVF